MLTLPIKKKWYDMIRAGKKLEEYRANTPYYAARFRKYEGEPVGIILRNGYRLDSPAILAEVVPKRRKGAKPEWGGNPEETCWVLQILAFVEVKR